MSRRNDPARVTAERIAALLEAKETAPVVRDLLRLACISVDCFSAERVSDADFDFQFGAGDEVTPALIRRKLPRMLRKAGHWRAAHYAPHELYEPAEKGGAE
jgi:hypothetical protein